MRRVICSAVALLALAIVPAALADGAPVGNVDFGGAGVLSADGATRYVALPGPGATQVLRISVGAGQVLANVRLRGLWGIPILTLQGETGGVSRDGSTLVLEAQSGIFPRRSSFEVVRTREMRARRLVLRGAFSYDALSPDGEMLYLIQRTSARQILDYRVRAYDLARGRLLGRTIVDRREPDERMRGYPLARVQSPDGAWAYTLYSDTKMGFFVHALDTVHARARCIDLPWHGAPNSGLRVVLHARMLLLSSPGRAPLRLDTRSFRVTPVRAAASGPPRRAPARNGAAASGGDRSYAAAGGGLLALAAAGAAASYRTRRRAKGRSA